MGLLGDDVRINEQKKGNHNWFLIAVFVLGIGVVGWIAKGLVGVSSEMREKYPVLNAGQASPVVPPSGVQPAQNSSAPDISTSLAQRQGAGDLPWTVTTFADKLTDRQTVEATATAAAEGDSTLTYKLKFRCDAQQRAVTLSAFEQTELGLMPRFLPFETRVTDDAVIEFKGFSVRRDSEPVQRATLIGGNGQEANAGAWGELTGDVANLAALNPELKLLLDKLGEAAGRQPGHDLSAHIPTTRLVFADIFPTETVEFLFASLSGPDRTALTTTCFPAASRD